MAAGWSSPGHDPGAWLLKGPAAGLFDRMVPATQRSQIALAGAATEVVGHRVVLVTSGGGAQAAGKRAGGLPDLDQVAQGGGRPVSGRLPGVAARIPLQPA